MQSIQVPKVPNYIIEALKQIQLRGFEAYVVGGAVRDYLLNKPCHDWDLATSALPEQIKNIFPKVYDSGIKHGTVTVLLEDHIEITTYRGEGEYSDGRHPDEVFFVNCIEEDLARRDFTMNAIAFNPVQNKFVDPFNGIQDIQNKTIKAVRNAAQRFAEDGLRPMRGIRFECTLGTLGFNIEENTYSAIKGSIETFKKVSIERIQSELMKILGSEKPSKGFQTLLDVGFLEHFLPEMIPMVGCSQNKYHEYDVWKHTLYTMDYVKNTPILKLAALFHDIAKVSTKGIHPKTGEGTFYNHEDVGYTMTQNIMERLKFSNEEIKLVSELVLNHFIHLEANASKSAIRRWVRKVGINSLDDIFELAIADINAKGNAKTPLDVEWIHSLKNKIQGLVIEEGEPISSNTLAINGHDVMEALNLKPGKQVGDVLKNLLELVTDNPELNIREILLEKIKSITL